MTHYSLNTESDEDKKMTKYISKTKFIHVDVGNRQKKLQLIILLSQWYVDRLSSRVSIYRHSESESTELLDVAM